MKKLIILLILCCMICGCYQTDSPEPDYVFIQGVRFDLNKELAGFGERERAHLRKIYVNLGNRQ